MHIKFLNFKYKLIKDLYNLTKIFNNILKIKNLRK